MGFYIRQSVRVGPFRFNISKSGVGVSAGVRGFRVGTGPRGNYVHMGRHGLYYRVTLPSGRSRTPPRPPDSNALPPSVPPEVVIHPIAGEKEITSGDVTQVVDSSSQQLIDEIRQKERRATLWPVVLLATLAASLASFVLVLPIAFLLSLLTLVILTPITYMRDKVRKSVVVLYEVTDEFEQVFQAVHDSFSRLSNCDRVWHLQASADVKDQKYHAGASTLYRRKTTSLSVANPPRLKTNIATPCIKLGKKKSMYFFPDRVLIFDGRSVGAVTYDNMDVIISPSRFIEEDRIPKDAEVVDTTWRYVNKKGGPDKRFKNNAQLPVVLYEEVRFQSSTGLNEAIQLSRYDIAAPFASTLELAAKVLNKYRKPE